MSVLIKIDHKKSEKRARELKSFLLELDSVCDKLYNRLEYEGIWDLLMDLEDVRIKYYVEYYEHQEIIKGIK